MKYRTLGSTQLDVSVVGVGTWQFGGEWGVDFDQPTVDGILDVAHEEGINLIDTAECYGDHLSESLIGDYVSRRNRDDWIVATKFGHKFHAFLDRDTALRPDEVRQQLEDSLRALRVDVIDLYQFHSGTDEDFDNEELWSMLSREKQAGKIRHLGVSIASKGGPHQAERAKAVGAEVIQVVYNRLTRRPETDFFPAARRDHLGVLARVPLASGFLSGKYRTGDTFSPHDVRATYPQEKIERLLREVETVRREELPAQTPMAEWALAWCLQNDVVHSVIPGCKSVEQVRANAAAAAHI